ncbi:glycosyl transferase family 1 [Patiriisocius marinistellae]|uniref:Glycosyl transferase family 1 n=1 Tax=Patiriisocius marinistellae TaxID=2494560 RepID=A0A5J4FZ91_9FLAO|nr:glycosyltransferase family 4 protein [Patiriisocius marinistellae]GEQ86494.1 glycosyl transferase family 1 [Patiriisocius marinistellae]
MKKALIICYYWPPAGGPGVQRWLKFATYLKSFDVEPIMYVPSNPEYPIVDEVILNEVPSDIKVLKRPINEPYRFAKMFSKKKTKTMSSGIISEKKISFVEKLLLYVRGNFFIPDARVGWVNPSVDYLEKYISENKIDVAITSGPPHSLHLIGLKLKESIGVKWITDFRDPWTTIHYHKSLRLSESSAKKHKSLESKILNSADQIIVTSPSTKEEFKAITQKPITVITNGYELHDLKPVMDTSFTLAHIGSLLSERNPLLLWDVLAEIAAEDELFREDLKIVLTGVVSEEVKSSISQVGLSKNCILTGYVSHKKALQLQCNAQVLLLLEINSEATKAIIPGKLFEYMLAKRPIIAIGPKGSDMFGILKETKSGASFTSEDKMALKKQITIYYKQYQKGELTVISEGIEKYSRKNLTGNLATLIKKTIAS